MEYLSPAMINIVEELGSTERWSTACQIAYSLKPISYSCGSFEFQFMGSGNYCRRPALSTAPYIGLGGAKFHKSDNLENDLAVFLQSEHLENHRYLLVKSLSPLLNSVINKHVIIDRSFYTFILDLSMGLESIWKYKLASKTRNQVRKGEKHVSDIRIGGHDLLADFYYVLSRAWRDLGTPTHSRRLFAGLLDEFGSDANIMMVYFQDKPASAALAIRVGDTLFHPFAATLKRYNEYSLNNALYWNLIRHAIDNSCNTFNMEKSPWGSGTYKYKTSWGAEPLQIYYYYFTRHPKSVPNFHNSKLVALATTAWRKTPISFANWVGPRLIRHVYV